MDEARINASMFLGFGLLIVGSVELLFANTPAGIGLLTGAIVSFLVSLYYMRVQRKL